MMQKRLLLAVEMAQSQAADWATGCVDCRFRALEMMHIILTSLKHDWCVLDAGCLCAGVPQLIWML